MLSFTEEAGPCRQETGGFILDVHQVAGLEFPAYIQMRPVPIEHVTRGVQVGAEGGGLPGHRQVQPTDT